LLLAIRHMAREAGGRTPNTARIDALLDERSATMVLNTTQLSRPSPRWRAYRTDAEAKRVTESSGRRIARNDLLHNGLRNRPQAEPTALYLAGDPKGITEYIELMLTAMQFSTESPKARVAYSRPTQAGILTHTAGSSRQSN